MVERRPETPAEVDGTAGLFVALGKMVKLLRERKGLTQKEFGELVGYGPDAVSAMERGVRTLRPEVLLKADELLDAGGLLKEVVPEVEEAMTRARTRHPEWYRSYAGLEAEAVELHFYANHGVPGLLQTEDYARAVFSKRRPLLDEETIEKRVTDRLSRQLVFERWPSPMVSYVLEEIVLDRPIGGRRVHADQLRHLLRVGGRRNIEIQVMPSALDEHPNMDGAFNLLTPKGHGQVAYTEVQGYPRLVTDSEEVRKIADRYGIMRAMALPPSESRKLIEQKLEEL
ncbi:helix-turn-helix transcriptional regulator [Streptomyces griseorubiginosus]|uniref:helix-turn-helix domain-containing protein n=1 Tax=Streptomyces griseorubiginosus TaxID=67304 RepID=UPI002E8229DA|nr:helix-turn-helix transcriptional regulator [Streptomyces griseorubiginosus]WUB45096.1 helix-turn-helix transcriptional regulator [Streptomyces griseorubiginosus]WUB53613.1 helix-turn-helix transcriptional regulator [Streptomyces griseorubiginosus]